MVGDVLRTEFLCLDIQHGGDRVLFFYPEIIEFIRITYDHGVQAVPSGERGIHQVNSMIFDGRIDDGIVVPFRNEAAD